MNPSLDSELVELAELVAPPLIDIDELYRLVAIDEAHDYLEGECTEHEGCRPVSAKRFW